MQNYRKSGSRWRKKAKRGVSPIIATILLVAITVVLAAVLYVLISGLTRGPGNTPLGSAMAVSGATASSKSTWFNETISIQSASSGVTANSLKMELQASGGTIATFPTAVTLIDVSGCTVGYWTASGAAPTQTAPGAPAAAFGHACGASPGLTSQISSGDQLVITSTSSLSGAGYSLSVIGTGSYSGSISAAIP
ncbi:MAG TPA: archaellin/type IV pilin N-terminal domain-containing protein [Thermoplasmata archaeon]|nr:archaellin/type IV pilin N-terminal domain-containing protein [Thermoplasmata archaeon]